jgi:hypothetical protein
MAFIALNHDPFIHLPFANTPDPVSPGFRINVNLGRRFIDLKSWS